MRITSIVLGLSIAILVGCGGTDPVPEATTENTGDVSQGLVIDEYSPHLTTFGAAPGQYVTWTSSVGPARTFNPQVAGSVELNNSPGICGLTDITGNFAGYEAGANPEANAIKIDVVGPIGAKRYQLSVKKDSLGYGDVAAVMRCVSLSRFFNVDSTWTVPLTPATAGNGVNVSGSTPLSTYASDLNIWQGVSGFMPLPGEALNGGTFVSQVFRAQGGFYATTVYPHRTLAANTHVGCGGGLDACVTKAYGVAHARIRGTNVNAGWSRLISDRIVSFNPNNSANAYATASTLVKQPPSAQFCFLSGIAGSWWEGAIGPNEPTHRAWIREAPAQPYPASYTELYVSGWQSKASASCIPFVQPS